MDGSSRGVVTYGGGTVPCGARDTGKAAHWQRTGPHVRQTLASLCRRDDRSAQPEADEEDASSTAHDYDAGGATTDESGGTSKAVGGSRATVSGSVPDFRNTAATPGRMRWTL